VSIVLDRRERVERVERVEQVEQVEQGSSYHAVSVPTSAPSPPGQCPWLFSAWAFRPSDW